MVRAISEDQVLKLCGIDVALYLVYLKQTAQFFALISFINVIFLFLFITGSPNQDDDFR